MPTHFGLDHYVPVLRAKAAEWKALSNLDLSIRRGLTPILELPPSAFAPGTKKGQPVSKNPNEVVGDFLAKASAAASQHPVFLDFSLVGGSYPGGSDALWATLAARAVEFTDLTIPVIPLSGSGIVRAEARNLLDKLRRGCCLRVSGADVARGLLHVELPAILAALGISAENVDLVIDLSTCPTQQSHAALRTQIPFLAKWRTWTVIAGVFPVDLTEFSASQQVHYHPRIEWTHFLSEIAAGGNARRPTFGDFTTQHGRYLPSPAIAGSASLRYALSDRWLILRGEKPDVAKNGGYSQMYGHARLLQRMPEFYGAGFSWGDDVIDQCAPPIPTGNAGQWLAVGICHHMTVAVIGTRALGAQQLASPTPDL